MTQLSVSVRDLRLRRGAVQTRLGSANYTIHSSRLALLALLALLGAAHC